MIQKTFLFCLFCLSLGMLSSCIDLDNETDKDVILPIDPPFEPMFQFDEHGVPYRLGNPNLSTEMQQDLKKEAIGYGWKWMQTNDIMADGNINNVDHYKDIEGTSPTSYYIKSDKELISYFWANSIPAMAFLAQGFSLDAATGTLSNDNYPNEFFFRVWNIYELKGVWYMTVIEPLGVRVDKDGVYETVWGCSQYRRMSEDELKKMEDKYTFDYSQLILTAN